MLATRIRTIRDLRLVCRIIPGNVSMSRFVEANKTIERFELVSRFGRAEVVHKELVYDVARIIRSFSAAKSLRELFVLDICAMRSQMFNDRSNWRDVTIADSCVPLRGRCVYVNVFGITYPV